jgi:hypothetical protein
MKSHAIQISLDLGERQHLWLAVQDAFAELLRVEPDARHAALLMLVRMSQEAERPFQIVANTQLPLGLVAAVARTATIATANAAGVEESLTRPINCAARPSGDGRIYCDRCAKWWPICPPNVEFVCAAEKRS